MRLQAREIEVSETDPFEHDCLGLRDSSEALTNFISRCDGPGVIVVDRPWGSGKTTFLRMWQKQYENEGGSVVHFNAWHTDYFDDVLVSVIEEIRRQLTDGSDSSKLMASVKDSAVDLMKALIPFGARVATAGVLNITSADLKGLDDVAEGLAAKKLDAYEESKNSLNRFKNDLRAFVENIRQDGDKPVVIVVDELDRCRPSYAIEVLETIKHIFDIEGLVFLLATDLDQLAGVVSGRYGDRFNAKAYLIRFFDIRVTIPEPEDLSALVESFMERMDASELFPSRRDNYIGSKANLISALQEIGAHYDLSKRDIQRVLASLGTYAATVDNNHVVFPFFATWLAIIRHHDNELYRDVSSERLSSEQIASSIRERVPVAFWRSHVAAILVAEVLVVLEDRDQLTEIANTPDEHPSIASCGADNGENYVFGLTEHIGRGSFMLRGPYLRYIISRMELLEPVRR